MWALLEDNAKEHKEQARLWVANHLREESSKGVDAVVNGQVIGSVTRSKDSEKTDVLDWPAFLTWVAEHQPDMLSVDYRVKDTFLRKLSNVDGTYVDPDGLVVPGVGTRISQGSVRVNKTGEAREVLRGYLAHGLVRLEGLRTPPALEQTA